jgi:IclR family KDG regulon transcriptional repressor
LKPPRERNGVQTNILEHTLGIVDKYAQADNNVFEMSTMRTRSTFMKQDVQVANSPDEDRGMIKSLQKALAVLEAVSVAETPPRIAEVALEIGISRPTAYRIAQTLIAEGYLRQAPDSGRLSIGYSVLQQSARLLDGNRMRIEALPHLQHLATVSGERTNLGILHKNKVLYLAGVEKPSLPTIYSRFGKTAPAHCWSLGKAILAHLPEKVVRNLISAEPLIAQTPKSITGVVAFLEELEIIRKQGYAADCEEHMLNSFCIAATIFDGQNRAVGAIGISGKNMEQIAVHIPVLRLTADKISHVL